jgi:type I restriction enzyme S subunit
LLDNLPSGWNCTKLRDIAEIVGGITKDSKKSLEPGFREVPYLRVANVQRGRLDLTDIKSIHASEADIQKLSLRPGDILLNEGGDRDKLGRGWIWQGQLPLCIHQNHVFRARLLSQDIDPVYLAHFTNSIAQSYFSQQGSQTTNLASISLSKIGSLPVLVPPRAEQTRIVAKLEELLSELDAGVAELKVAQKKLQQYRQSLLKAAVEGSLTASWRETQRKLGTPAETGAQLLQRILTERRARWEAKQLAKFKEQGKTPPKDWQKKYPEPVQPDTTDLPELPEGWVWASLDMLGEIVSGVAKGTKRDGNVSVREVPYLRVANVQRGYLDLSEVKTILATERDIEELTLQNGDVLFNEGGDRDKLGRGWVWRNEVAECIHQNHVFRMRPYSSDLQPELISHHGNTFGKLWFQTAGKQTTNLASINMGLLRSFPVPVAPADEQQEILAQMQVQLDSLGRQEEATDSAMKRATAQRQNILRAAFAGQLVPQDPNDEPASVLLERIRAERASQAGVKKPRRRKADEASHA